QKIVIKVHMTCDNCRRNDLALAGSTCGVQSVAIEAAERDQLVVASDGVDAASLASRLRKAVKVGRADIIKVEAVVHGKKAAATKPPGQAAAVAAGSSNPYYPGYGCYCPRNGTIYPYAAGHCYVEDSDEGSWCTIM
uniref:HMA domain-containing protein n=1 Tax=Setaria italica TaxID=4555 RepID=K3YCK2_SETIT